MFQLTGLDHRLFEALFELPDARLAERGMLRQIADHSPGFPCRVSLEDARPGDELLLLPYTHHAVDSPYRASGPIYVRRGARQRVLAPGEVPAYVTRRIISLRAYDRQNMMLKADVVQGTDVAQALTDWFTNDAILYVQLHNAKQGCFSCQANR